MKTISVIIASYRVEPYIRATIDSVLAQTRQPLEIIIADDASPDKTCEIIRSYGSRIRLIENKENAGPGARRNQATAVATGDYLAMLDGDDLWRPHHLHDLAALLDEHPDVAVAVGQIEKFRDAGTVIDEPLAPLPCTDKPADALFPIMRGIGIWTSSVLIRRAAFEAVGGFNEIVEFCNGRRVQAEDFDLFLRLSERYPFIAWPTPTILYRVHPRQSSALIAPQSIITFKYRNRFLRDWKPAPGDVARKAAAIDRMQRSWEEYLEHDWTHRDLASLRLRVRYGLTEPLLRHITKPYRLKSMVPAALARKVGHAAV